MTKTTPTGYCTYYLSPIKVLTVFLPPPPDFCNPFHSPERDRDRERHTPKPARHEFTVDV